MTLNYITNIHATCTANFDANGGTLTTRFAEGCAVTYVSVGVYLVTFEKDLLDRFYTVALGNGAANRLAGDIAKVESGFRITYGAASTGVPIDVSSSFPISFTVFARVKARVY